MKLVSFFRQNVSWISKLEAPCVTFLGLLTNIKMNRDGKFLYLFACFAVILKFFSVKPVPPLYGVRDSISTL